MLLSLHFAIFVIILYTTKLRKGLVILLMCSGILLPFGCSKNNNVCSSSTLYIPNSFTPNGDGLNDTFGAKGTELFNYQMSIYDANGSQIFHCSDFSVQWDGKAQGSSSICPEGVYEYKIVVTDACQTTHTYMGNVALIK